MSSRELVISSTRHETRLAIMEDDQLVEVFFQRSNEYSLAGSIHKGRVTRVLPGMQSAFVDLGLERDTFLYVSDFYEEHSEDIDKVTGGAEERPATRTPSAAPRAAGNAPREEDRRGGRRDRGGRDRGDRGERRGDRDRSRIIAPDPQAPPPLADAAPMAYAAEDATADLQAEDGSERDFPIDAVAASSDGEGTAAASAPAVDGRERPRGDRDRNAARDAAGRDARRGRRRGRGRGRGLPDSKYAPVGGTTDEGSDTGDDSVDGADAPEVEAWQVPIAVAEESEVFLLPGESLRKYRGAQPPPLPAAYVPNPAPVAVAPVIFKKKEEKLPEERSPQLPPPLPYVALTPEPEPAVVEESVPEVLSLISEEPAERPAANAMPDAPLHPERIEFLNEEQIQEALDDSDPLDDFEAAADAAQEAAEGGLHDNDEDPEIQAMILNGEELSLDSVQDDAERTADSTPLTAEVRDRNQRFLRNDNRQDNNRRQRGRRGRGRERTGDRPPQQQTPAAGEESGTAAAPQLEAAPVASGTGPAPVTFRTDRKPEREREHGKAALPSISDLLKEGQEIIVQIAKEPLGQKGARITSHIALPGRYVVFMPTVDHMGVSRKIASDEERHRLKRILQGVRGSVQGGCIIRTAGEGQPDEEIVADITFLHNLWQDIKHKAEKRPAPLLLHHDLDIVQRVLRDQFNESYKAVWVDNEEMYESILRFVQRFQPALLPKVKLYTRSTPIFDAFNISNELEKALRPKVWLKSGGYIVINQTEALVAIDINTGKFVGKSNRLEDTIVRTNLEAVNEIVRQIRLRDLGGIIVIDFIDMDERKNRQRVMQCLEEAMRLDRAPYKILQFNDFGLVAVTRKRVKQSLERTLCSPCPYCEGAGYVKSVQTIVGEIVAEALKLAPTIDHSDVVLRCNPELAKLFKSHHNQYLEEIEEILKRPVLVKSDPTLHQEKFDLA